MADHEHTDECREYGCIEYATQLLYEAGQRRAKERAEAVRALRQSSIDNLIERSSLGTPGAKALREHTPPEVVERIMRKVAERTADDWTEGPCQPMHAGCTGAPHRPGCPAHSTTPTDGAA